MFTNVAHAEEVHETGIIAATYLLGPWYVATPIFLAAIAVIYYLTWLISSKNVSTALLVTAGALLVSGFVFAATYPIISILSITGGILAAGFMAFAGLADSK